MHTGMKKITPKKQLQYFFRVSFTQEQYFLIKNIIPNKKYFTG
jgi:hypothetical protein